MSEIRQIEQKMNILDQFSKNFKKFGKMWLEIRKFRPAKTADFGEFYAAVKGFPS